MGKLTTYILIISGVLLLYHYAGLISNTPLSFLIGVLIRPETITHSSYYIALAGVLGSFALVSAITLTFAANTKLELAALSSVAIMLFLVGWDLIAIWNVMRQFSVMLATLVISPLIIIYTLTVIEWWRGVTT